MHVRVAESSLLIIAYCYCRESKDKRTSCTEYFNYEPGAGRS